MQVASLPREAAGFRYPLSSNGAGYLEFMQVILFDF